MTHQVSVRKIQLQDDLSQDQIILLLSDMASVLAYVKVICQNGALTDHILNKVHDKVYYVTMSREDRFQYQTFVEEIQDDVLAVLSHLKFKDLPPSTSAKIERRKLGSLKERVVSTIIKEMVSREVIAMEQQHTEPMTEDDELDMFHDQFESMKPEEEEEEENHKGPLLH